VFVPVRQCRFTPFQCVASLTVCCACARAPIHAVLKADAERPSRMATHAMKTAFAIALVLVFAGTGSLAAAVAPPDWQAQAAHQNGTCGSLGPGSGLEGGKGWVVSMLPGKHEFRVRGGGSVYLTTARKTTVDFDVGRPYYIVIEGAAPGAVLEWKMLGRDWQPVARTFLYPPTR
jgi:hypothetical protein